MGDIADYINEQIEYEYELLYQWRHGHMTAEEAYDNGIIDEYGAEYATCRSTPTCRCCGTQGLHWEVFKGKWRLFDGRGLHNCPVNPLREQ